MAGSDAARDRFGLVGATLEGRFAVERVVDEGGFGVVYAAEHLALGVPVALKVLKLPSDLDALRRAEFVEAFAREARAIARLRHANIVQVYDSGVSATPAGGEPAPWIALEWVAGRTLAEVFAARRASGSPGFAPSEALAMLRPMFDAVGHAHAAGVAHRDLKPSNVMLVPGQEATTLRVLDFGIAKRMAEGESPGSGHTRTAGIAAFSPLYAAPEQLTGARTGPWTDVHALAMIVTEALTNLPPVATEQLSEVVRLRLLPDRPTPWQFGLDTGPWERVLARAMALAPAERHADARALCDDLAANVAGADAAVRAARGGAAGAFAATPPTRELPALFAAPSPAPVPSAQRPPVATAPGSAGAWPQATTHAPLVVAAPTIGPARPPAAPSSSARWAVPAAVVAAFAIVGTLGLVEFNRRGSRRHRDAPTPPDAAVLVTPLVPGLPPIAPLPPIVAVDSPDAASDHANAHPGARDAAVHTAHPVAPAHHCSITVGPPVYLPLGPMMRGRSRLRVESNDPEVSADVDGWPMAAGIPRGMPEGSHRLTVSRRGCESAIRDVETLPRQVAVVQVDVRNAPR